MISISIKLIEKKKSIDNILFGKFYAHLISSHLIASTKDIKKTPIGQSENR